MDAHIALVGMGPRGISTVERIGAYLSSIHRSTPLTLHLIDDAEIGAGRVWSTEQTGVLCMNTLAGAVTLFTEPGATVGAPVLEGPTMYEWIKLVRGQRDGVPERAAALFNAHPTSPDQLARFSAEIEHAREFSHPSRALYGCYLRWVYKVALAQLPGSVSVVTHHARAVDIVEGDAADTIVLSDGTRVTSHATVLSTGWVLNEPDARFAASSAPWVAPDNPVEQDLSLLPAGQRVLVRGLGMGFYDLMALSFIGRGGRFEPDPATRSGLRYLPSGDEPRLVATSGRGYPFVPKSDYRSLPPRPTRRRHAAALRTLADAAGPIRFGTDLWPALVRDAYEAYYRTLHRVYPDSLVVSPEEIVRRIDNADLEAVSSPYDIDAVPAALRTALAGVAERDFDMVARIHPLRGTQQLGIAELSEHIAQLMTRDIAEATAAWDSPEKAALWEISAARKPTGVALENGRSAEADRAGALRQYMSFGQMIGSGPPLFRTRELLALVDAGYVEFFGPDPEVRPGSGGYRATSGSRATTARVLADAFLPDPDVTRCADPLMASLLRDGRIRPFSPFKAPTAAPETDGATRRVVRSNGTLDPRLHISGIPTNGQWADTTISPMPGTDAPFLQETDKVAASLLRAATGRTIDGQGG